MKRVLLTGAGGAIGCHVLAYLLEKTDWHIVCTDSFMAEHKGYFDRLTKVTERMKNEWPLHLRVSLIQHDLTAPFTPREVAQMGEINYIINLASRSDVQNSIGDPLNFVQNNTNIMLTMLELARAIRPETFLHFSTDEVYGPAPKDGGGHKEWEPHIPSNPYSASKAMQEDMCIAWWRCYGVPLIITNTMNNFGPMQAPSKFPAMIQTKLKNDETIIVHASGGEIGTRYYIHSRNTADAILFILQNISPVLHSYGQIDRPVRLNIVGDKQVSNLELVKTIARLMGKTPEVEIVDYHKNNPGHDIHYGLNGDKLAGMGWRSPKSFEESLKDTIDWQQENPEWL